MITGAAPPRVDRVTPVVARLARIGAECTRAPPRSASTKSASCRRVAAARADKALGPLVWGHSICGDCSECGSPAAAANGPQSTRNFASWSLRREVFTSAAQRVKTKEGSRSTCGAGKVTAQVLATGARSVSRTASPSSGYHGCRKAVRTCGAKTKAALLSK